MSFNVSESSFPISLYELNNILEKSQNPNEIKNSFTKFRKVPIFSLEFFAQSLGSLIPKFSDLNKENWSISLDHIRRIFTNPSPYETNVLNNLSTKIQKVLGYHLNPKKIIHFISLDDIKTSMRLSSHFPPENKIKRLMIANLSEQERLLETKQLETLLTCIEVLYQESQFIKSASRFIEKQLMALKFDKEQVEGADKILGPNLPFGKIPFFEIKSMMENKETFEFWIQFSPYLDLCWDKETLYASLSYDSFLKGNFQKLQKKLHDWLIKTTSQELKKILKSLGCLCQMAMNSEGYLHEIQNLLKEFKTLYSLQEKHPKGLSIISPTHSLKKFLEPIVREAEEELVNYNLQEIFETAKQIVDLWILNYDNQKSLDSAMREQWNSLTQKKSKKPKEKPKGSYWPLKQIINPLSKIFVCPEIKMLPIEQKNTQKQILTKPITANQKKETTKPITAKPPKLEKEQVLSLPPLKEKKIEQLSLHIAPSVFPYEFDDRVNRWRNHPFGTPLPRDIFGDYAECDLNHQKLMQIYHDPHPYVDQCLHLGFEGEWINTKKTMDKRIVIPSEITWEGANHRGFFAYTINPKTKVCYHKFFTQRIDKDIVYETVKRKFNENDFPVLRQAEPTKCTMKPKFIRSENSSIYTESSSGNVTITDYARNIEIKLFNCN